MENGVEAEVAELMGCLKENNSQTGVQGIGWEEGGTREVLSSSGTSRKERICSMSSEGRAKSGAVGDCDSDINDYCIKDLCFFVLQDESGVVVIRLGQYSKLCCGFAVMSTLMHVVDMSSADDVAYIMAGSSL